MAEVERVEVRRVEGSPDRSGAYTIMGIILGVLIVAGVALAIIGIPQIEAWWADSPPPAPSTTTIITPNSN